MKNGITIFFLLWQMQTCLLHAQAHDRVLSFGFNTRPFELHALGNGRWLTVVSGEPLPGGIYSDTIVAVVFNSDGEILQRIHLPLPVSETHNIRSATRTPDGGFAIAVANDLCDTGFNEHTILVFNKDGTLRWSKQTTDTEKQPNLLKIAPDGNLVGLFLNQLTKFSTATGQILWKAGLNLNNDFPEIYDFQFYPGTENIMAVGYPDLQFWENTGPDEAPVFELSNSKNITPSAYLTKLFDGPGGAYYTFDSGRLFMVEWPGLDYFTVSTYPSWIFDIDASVSGFYISTYDVNSTISYILQTNGSGQITDTLLASRWQTGLKIALQNNTLAIAGVSGSGPYWAGPYGLPYNATHLWLHTRPLSGGAPEPDVNAALVAVEQNEPLQVTVTPGSPWHPDEFHHFSGGKFRVQLLNAGNTVLHQAAVQIAFDWDYSGGICLERPAKQMRYAGLDLAPGETVWLDFGDIEAAGQTKAPTQLCFWTSAPNERPDANHDDDVFCHTAVVAAAEPGVTGFSIESNPAIDGCWLTFPGKQQTVGRVFDISGHLLRQIELPAGNTRFYLDTSNWATGIYLLQIENWCGKIIVQQH